MEYGSAVSVARHRELMELSHIISASPFTGLLDISIAYNTLTVFYDPVIVFQHTGFSPIVFITGWLQARANELVLSELPTSGTGHIIPVCYEPPYSPDLEMMAAFHNISMEEIIRLHLANTYYVFMVGFSPGFPYLGLVDERIEMPRKSSPSLRVPAGSVGIAGRQTGIYPFASPGGWNIIGRTPLRIFDIHDPALCILRPGDTVSFSAIDRQTFNYLDQYADS